MGAPGLAGVCNGCIDRVSKKDDLRESSLHKSIGSGCPRESPEYRARLVAIGVWGGVGGVGAGVGCT